MAERTTIEWCDATWNPVTGCTPISTGCQNCWAKQMANRQRGRNGYPADDPFRVTFQRDRLKEPLAWRKPRRIAVSLMGDLFHKDVPFAWIDDVFEIMALSGQHTFLVLTKRPERMAEYLTRTVSDQGDTWNAGQANIEGAAWRLIGEPDAQGLHWTRRWPLPNVWLGVSVENQAAANERIPWLLKCPAAVRFLSMEPMLAPVNLRNICHQTEHDGYRSFGNFWDYNCENDCTWRGFESELEPDPDQPEADAENNGVRYVCPECYSDSALMEREKDAPKIDWVIVGGESGPKARICDVDAVRRIVEDCRLAGVRCFVKQLGSNPYLYDPEVGEAVYIGPGSGGIRHPKGGDPADPNSWMKVQ